MSANPKPPPYQPPPLPPEEKGEGHARVALPTGGPEKGGEALAGFETTPKPVVLEGEAFETRGQVISKQADEETFAAMVRLLKGETPEDREATEARVARVFVELLSARKSIDAACFAVGMSVGEFNLHLLRHPVWRKHCDTLIRQNLIAQGSKIPEIISKIEDANQVQKISHLRAALMGAERAFTAGHKVKGGGGGGGSGKKAPRKIGSIGGLTAQSKDSYDKEEQEKYDRERKEEREEFEKKDGKNEY